MAAAAEQKKVYQFKITLKNVKPSIWRRIQVPEDYDFENLSDAILCAMGWFGTHLHEFEMKNPITGEKDKIGEKPGAGEFGDSCTTVWEKRAKIRDYFIDNKSKATYEYDFGDGWDHVVQLMKILPAEPGMKYPRILAGKGACPPEDCGGCQGYMELLEIRKKEDHTQEEKEQLQWYELDEEDFDPLKFDIDLVEFEPLNRMKNSFPF